MDIIFSLSVEITEKLESSSITQIRKRLTLILKSLFEVFKCTFHGFSKILYLSIFLVIADAMFYIQKYYADDSFDNRFIDGNLKEFWNREGKAHLTPLRNWELKREYQIARSFKISKEEGQEMLIAAIPTVVAFVFILTIVFADFEFSQVSDLFYNNFSFIQFYIIFV